MATPVLTLDNVEPYDPSRAQQSPNFVQPQTYAPDESGTVAGQMSGLLSPDSPYMEVARTKGIQFANQRGLLHTSLAGEASQKAAIESALPIAQQDAKAYTDAGLSRQAYEQQAGLTDIQAGAASQLATQEAQHKGALAGQQIQAQSALSTQEAQQTRQLAEYSALVQSGLSAQEAQQRLGLSTQEAQQTRQLAEYGALVQSGLSAQEAQQRLGLSTQEAQQTRQLAEYSALVQSGLSAQEAQQRLGLSTQEAQQTRQLAEYGALVQSGLSAQEAQQRLGLSAQEAQQAQVLAAQQADLAFQLSSQEAAQDIALRTLQEDALNTRHAAEMALEEYLQTAELSSIEVKAMGSSITLLGQTLSEQIAKIQVDPNMTADAKTTIVGQLTDTYQANVESVGQIYGVPIIWN